MYEGRLRLPNLSEPVQHVQPHIDKLDRLGTLDRLDKLDWYVRQVRHVNCMKSV